MEVRRCASPAPILRRRHGPRARRRAVGFPGSLLRRKEASINAGRERHGKEQEAQGVEATAGRAYSMRAVRWHVLAPAPAGQGPEAVRPLRWRPRIAAADLL